VDETPLSMVVRNEGLYRLLECSSDGLFEVDSQGRCAYCNAGGAHLLGYEAQELMGSVLHDIIHAGGTFLAPAECSVCQALIGEPTRRNHGVLLHKDGRAIPVSYSGAPILANGALRGAVMSFYDDSQRLRLEGELRDRTAEVAESERRKTEFIAILAHELRNPLAPLRAALQVMRKASDNATSMAQLRSMMERQLQQLVHLSDDLLDIARVTSGQISLKKGRIALKEILDAALETSAPLRETNRNTLTLDLPAESPVLQGDATRLTQVFTNILNNAAQYSAPGGPISVRVESSEGLTRIEIADAGVGIARDALNRIFDMFTRVGHDAKHMHAGLGIGLNLSRRLVEMHGGQLVAASEGLEKGSRFLITLPLSEAASKESASNALPTEAAGREQIRALIVDDNVDAAGSLSLLLQLGGHAICTAYNGADALILAPEFKPDIVLLDIGMPGMSGYEVAAALRAMPEVGHPVLVAVTAWGSPEDRLKSKAAGFDEHLTKPVDISMIELLLTTLPRRQPTSEQRPPVKNGHSIDTSS
jgi:PAS domain S-box-containing protein